MLLDLGCTATHSSRCNWISWRRSLNVPFASRTSASILWMLSFTSTISCCICRVPLSLSRVEEIRCFFEGHSSVTSWIPDSRFKEDLVWRGWTAWHLDSRLAWLPAKLVYSMMASPFCAALVQLCQLHWLYWYVRVHDAIEEASWHWIEEVDIDFDT